MWEAPRDFVQLWYTRDSLNPPGPSVHILYTQGVSNSSTLFFSFSLYYIISCGH